MQLLTLLIDALFVHFVLSDSIINISVVVVVVIFKQLLDEV